ncbi:MAG: CPBP family intramembrane glutamic endopeptidase [Candidatus Sericytochromatia bacterium]
MDISRKAIVNLLIGQEIFLIIISLLWVFFNNTNSFKISGLYAFFELNPFNKFHIDLQSFFIGLAVSIILIFLSILIASTYEPFKKSMLILDEMIINKIQIRDIFPLALFSGVGEEIFFRGLLQEGIGIYFSNIIFALLHFPAKEFWVYALWTLFAGLFLGNVYSYTNNLFIVIIAHVFNNFLALFIWKKFKHKIISNEK